VNILHIIFISIDSYAHINIYIFVTKWILVIYLLHTREIFFALF